MKLIVLLTSLIFTSTVFANNTTCSEKEITTAEMLERVVPPGDSEKEFNNLEFFKRTRSCTEITGCEDWSEWNVWSKTWSLDLHVNQTVLGILSSRQIDDEFSYGHSRFQWSSHGGLATTGLVMKKPGPYGSMWQRNLNLKFTDNCIRYSGIHYEHKSQGGFTQSEIKLDVAF